MVQARENSACKDPETRVSRSLKRLGTPGSSAEGRMKLKKGGQATVPAGDEGGPGLWSRGNTGFMLALRSGESIPGRGDIIGRKGLEAALGSSQRGGSFQLLMGSEPAPGAGREREG